MRSAPLSPETSWLGRALAVVAVVVASLGALSGPLHAHEFHPALLDIEERPDGLFDTRWTVALVGNESAIPLAASTLDLDGTRSLDPIAALRAEFSGKVVYPLLPEACRPTTPPRSTLRGHTLHYAWIMSCGDQGLDGGTIEIRGLDIMPVDVVVRIDLQDGLSMTRVLRSTNATLEIDLVGSGTRPGAPRWDVFGAYLWLGFEHILEGVDHLLFVFALLLIVLRRAQQRPAKEPGRERSPLAGTAKPLIATVTGFTLGHSITLGAAVIYTFALPGPFVEFMIALSVFMLAVELAAPENSPPTLALRHPWLVAFAFGLLHGFGFSDTLMELGLAPDRIPLSLAAFNIGVELGQLAFVGVVLVIIAAGRRLWRTPPTWSRWVPIYGMGIFSFVWLVERAIDVLDAVVGS